MGMFHIHSPHNLGLFIAGSPRIEPGIFKGSYYHSPGNICKNLDNSYFSLSLKRQVMVGTMEDGRYAINGKLWKVKKGYKQQRIACI
jgi:hypothetical protein